MTWGIDHLHAWQDLRVDIKQSCMVLHEGSGLADRICSIVWKFAEICIGCP
jgi:hypothetical protein